MTAAAEIEGLTKIFPVPMRRQKVLAVSDLNLRVEKGEVYGLLGPNGSGKSTTLKILLGLVSPTRGKCRIFGEPSTDYRSHRHVGFLPENPYFYKFLTANETLRFYGKLCGLQGRKLKARVDEILELVGMEDARERRVGGFSKGMLQRIGLAQAMMQDPDLLVLDEPTAGVDPVGSRGIRDLILRLKGLGKTVLLTSHLLEQVQEVCDRVGIMAKGRMLREGRLMELVSVEGQVEYVVEGVPEGIEEKVRDLVEVSGGKFLGVRRSRMSLEMVFLRETLGQSEVGESQR